MRCTYEDKEDNFLSLFQKQLDFAHGRIWSRNSFEENKNSFDSINLENNDRVLKQWSVLGLLCQTSAKAWPHPLPFLEDVKHLF